MAADTWEGWRPQWVSLAGRANGSCEPVLRARLVFLGIRVVRLPANSLRGVIGTAPLASVLLEGVGKVSWSGSAAE